MGYCSRQVHRIHGWALQHFSLNTVGASKGICIAHKCKHNKTGLSCSLNECEFGMDKE